MHLKGPYEVLEKVGELDYKIKITGKVTMSPNWSTIQQLKR
jgi:hypothetical protein